MEKVREIKNSHEHLKSRNGKRTPRETGRLNGRNPARAYTLSLLLWGTGQNYNEERGKGLLFHLALLGLFVGAVLAGIFFDTLLRFLRAHGLSASETFLLAELLLFCLLIFWLFIAGDAYHSAAKARASRFPGIQNHVYPCLCSLLLPGWGQFLNGQPVKGSIFSALSVLGIFSLVSIPATLFLWPQLEASDARFMIEAVFAVSLVYAPLIPFVWLFSSYDALKVSLDDLKKESLWERIKSANNRRRAKGWARVVFPHLKSSIALALIITALWITGYKAFSKDFYIYALTSGRDQLQKQGMTVAPELVNRMLAVMPEGGR